MVEKTWWISSTDIFRGISTPWIEINLMEIKPPWKLYIALKMLQSQAIPKTK